jgi:hypothetical protein
MNVYRKTREIIALTKQSNQLIIRNENLKKDLHDQSKNYEGKIQQLQTTMDSLISNQRSEIASLTASIEDIRKTWLENEEIHQINRENTAIAYAKRVDAELFDIQRTRKEFKEYRFEIDFHSSAKLERTLNFSGSDKASRHGYHFFYAHLLAKQREIGTLLEIGVGSLDVKIESHMESKFQPGGSLKTWRSLLPEWNIIGIDIDPLLKAPHSGNYIVLQADQRSESQLRQALQKGKIDSLELVIDDGLHTPYAGYVALKTIWPLMSPGGVYIIEDIPNEHLPAWGYLVETLNFGEHVKIVRPVPSFNASFDSNILFFVKPNT